jgi:hypothetical protein
LAETNRDIVFGETLSKAEHGNDAEDTLATRASALPRQPPA